MKELDHLSADERNRLLMTPAYISLLAANADGKMDEEEKRAAIELSHIKTFSSPPLLKEFYRETEKVFAKNIDELDASLPKDRKERQAKITEALQEIRGITEKLDSVFGLELNKSLSAYTTHVSRAHWNVLASFVDPFY